MDNNNALAIYTGEGAGLLEQVDDNKEAQYVLGLEKMVENYAEKCTALENQAVKAEEERREWQDKYRTLEETATKEKEDYEAMCQTLKDRVGKVEKRLYDTNVILAYEQNERKYERKENTNFLMTISKCTNLGQVKCLVANKLGGLGAPLPTASSSASTTPPTTAAPAPTPSTSRGSQPVSSAGPRPAPGVTSQPQQCKAEPSSPAPSVIEVELEEEDTEKEAQSLPTESAPTISATQASSASTALITDAQSEGSSEEEAAPPPKPRGRQVARSSSSGLAQLLKGEGGAKRVRRLRARQVKSASTETSSDSETTQNRRNVGPRSSSRLPPTTATRRSRRNITPSKRYQALVNPPKRGRSAVKIATSKPKELKHGIRQPAPTEEHAQYECLCGRSFHRRHTIQAHVVSKNRGRIFKCYLCTYRADTHCGLKNHVTKFHKVPYKFSRFACGLCGLIAFEKPEELVKHHKLDHQRIWKRSKVVLSK